MFTLCPNWKIAIAGSATIAAALTAGLALRTGVVTAESGQRLVWTIDAMACVPNGPTTQNNLVTTSNGFASFQTGKIGNIDLACAFSDASLNGLTVREMEMRYIIGNGSGSVRARLRAVGKETGELLDVLDVTSKDRCLDVQGGPHYTYPKCSKRSEVGHVLDFDRYYYYVLLSMHRPSASTEVRVVGAGIR